MKWQKVKHVLIIIAAWLFVISILYIVYLKAKFFFNI